jgi:UDPglucose 6-dehydrogenase
MICVVGLGKVGLPLVAAFSSNNYKVLGLDNNKDIILSLQNKNKTFLEKKITKFIYNENVYFSNNLQEFKFKNRIKYFFLIVPTPSLKNGSFSLNFIKTALKKIFDQMNTSNKFTIVINSTVSPGSFDNEIVPYVKSLNYLKNFDYEIFYMPLFIALSDVLNGIINPKSILIGSNNKSYNLKRLINLINKITIIKKQVFHMSFFEAEVSKLSSNSLDTIRVAFMNLLGSIMTEKKDFNVYKTTAFLESRITNNLPYPGLSYGGPCWPRDNLAFTNFLDNYKMTNLNFTNNVHESNTSFRLMLLNKILIHLKSKGSILIIGTGYKIGTDEEIEGFSFYLRKCLKMNKYNYLACNYFNCNDFKKVYKKFKYVFIIDYKILSARYINNLINRNSFVFDFWNKFSRLKRNCRYLDFSGV